MYLSNILQDLVGCALVPVLYDFISSYRNQSKTKYEPEVSFIVLKVCI